MKKLLIALGVFVLLFSIAETQPTVIWHPLSPYGTSYGISYGSDFPTAANGYPPSNGMVAVRSPGGGAAAELGFFDASAGAWQIVSALTAGTTAVASDYAANDFDVANSVTGTTGGLVFEGATGGDGFQTTISVVDPTAQDIDFQIPYWTEYGAATQYPVMGLVAPHGAGGTWAIANGLVMEGAGVNDYEFIISAANDPTGGDTNLRLPRVTQASGGNGAFVISTLSTNEPDVADSVWFASNRIQAEGATADGYDFFIDFNENYDSDAELQLGTPAEGAVGNVLTALMNPPYDQEAGGELTMVMGDPASIGGTGGTVNALGAAAMTPSPSFETNGLILKSGYDSNIYVEDSTGVFRFNGNLKLGAVSGATVEVFNIYPYPVNVTDYANQRTFSVGEGDTIPSMNGDDNWRMMEIDVTNAGSHSGTNNYISMLWIDNWTEVANADTTAIRIQPTFSKDMWFKASDTVIQNTTNDFELDSTLSNNNGDIFIRNKANGDFIVYQNTTPMLTVNENGPTMSSFAQGSLPAASNGTVVYCTDCNQDATCTGSGSGAMAFRINGAWTCELN